MSILVTIILGFTGFCLAVFVFFRVKRFLRDLSRKKAEARRTAILPFLEFSLTSFDKQGESKNGLSLKNSGSGRAMDIQIKDFHHPDETAWHFQFEVGETLEPGHELPVNFEFYVGDQKASNKADLLWMFDSEHDHDFIAEIDIRFVDIDQYRYRQITRIGKGDQTYEPPISDIS